MIWKNWAGNVTANPNELRVANCEADLVNIVRDANQAGQKIRAVGTGHSFSEICATNGLLVSLEDHDVCNISSNNVATMWAGSKIGTAAAAMWPQGWSFENQGDIDVQSIAGALGTGTHGTGSAFGSFSARAESFRLVTAEGEIRQINKHSDSELFSAAALSVGMLGLVSEVGIGVVPAFHLREQTQALETDECFDIYSEADKQYRNIEFYWLPSLDKCILKTIDLTNPKDITGEDETELPPPGTIERYLRPNRANKAYLVYRNIRTVPFLEMEYSVPIENGIECLREIRALMQNRFPEKSWVVEYRAQAQDDLMLSPAFNRTVATISVHDEPGARGCDDYFKSCEDIFVTYDGRPHWGKLCFLSPAQRADRFPEFSRFSTIRKRLDPRGMFLNDYLRPLFA